MKYKKHTLKNRLRVIHVPTKGNPSVTVMVLVETGSNYEERSTNGLSHFLEHMVFKGTKRRPTSMDISRELDSLGANSNAFTSNEMTGYFAKAEKRHFQKLFDVIADIYLNPTLPDEELEKERGVILQEISMYEDLPQRKVWDVFSRLMYGETPAGRTIIGPVENIKKFKRKDFVDYRNKHYVAKKTIIIVSGDIKEKEVLAEAKKHFSLIPDKKRVTKQKVKEIQKGSKLSLYHKDTDQTHMILGFRTFGSKDKRRSALAVLSGVLGQGMSSRLYQRLREEMGVCYYVRAGFDQYTDHGYLSISTGVDNERVEEVVRALLEECKRLKTELVSTSELKKAKDFISGNLFMGLETTDALAEFYADQEITNGEIKTPSDISKSLAMVTPEEVRRLALELFTSDRLNFALVGKFKDSPRLKKLLVI